MAPRVATDASASLSQARSGVLRSAAQRCLGMAQHMLVSAMNSHTQCAVCATDLGLTLGKKCGRCSTRYCGAECQVQHWEEGGHDQLCKLNKKSRRRRAVQCQ